MTEQEFELIKKIDRYELIISRIKRTLTMPAYNELTENCTAATGLDNLANAYAEKSGYLDGTLKSIEWHLELLEGGQLDHEV